MRSTISDKDHRDIQGMIISGYRLLTHSLYLFIHFDDSEKTKAWLRAVVPDITNAYWDVNGETKKPDAAVNFAVTYQGLIALGYPAQRLKEFPAEFVAGMASRSEQLGDFDGSAPGKWEFGGPEHDAIHAVLILQAASSAGLDKLEQKYGVGLRLAADPQRGRMNPQPPQNLNREHFGFADGISQPEIDGTRRLRKQPEPGIDIVPTGEFILGYPNAYDMLPPTPTVLESDDRANKLPPLLHSASSGHRQKDFGRNGTYFVFRKLYQDVNGFQQFLGMHQSAKMPADLLAAKMVGRWKSGAPLVLSPHRDPNPVKPTNYFGYNIPDPDGLACPTGSHIRRANPRDDLEHNPEESIKAVRRHRILRRGVPYGPPFDPQHPDDEDRGLLFICMNASIRRQFEFLQQTWLNNPKFSGLSDDRDPIVGQGDTSMTIQEAPLRRHLKGIPRFVTMRGGEYFFMPSISALNYLSTL